MKKAIFCLALVFTAGIVFGQANVPAIVVTTFTTRGQTVTADDAEGITELFIAELAKQSGVRVVDRTSLDRVIREMRFQTSDWSNSQKTAQLGAALNAEFLVRGQINQLGPQISFAITALDIRTLEVVSSSTRNFSVDNIYSNGRDGLFYNMPSMANSISQDIDKRQNWFVGRWRTDDNRCILEFKPDGTIIIERYEYAFSYDQSYSYDITEGGGIANNGAGNYNVSGNRLVINIILQGHPDVKTFNPVVFDGPFLWNDSTKNSYKLLSKIDGRYGHQVYGLPSYKSANYWSHYYEFFRIR